MTHSSIDVTEKVDAKDPIKDNVSVKRSLEPKT